MVRKVISSGISTIKNSGLNAGDVMNGVFAVSEYKNAREEGDSVVKSVAKAGIDFAWGEFFYGGVNSAVEAGLGAFGIKSAFATTAIGLGLSLAPAIGQIAGVSMEQNTKVKANAMKQRGKLGSGYFDMSDSGYTMRQRSLNAIRQNGLNTQSVLGNEARTYFRS